MTIPPEGRPRLEAASTDDVERGATQPVQSSGPVPFLSTRQLVLLLVAGIAVFAAIKYPEAAIGLPVFIAVVMGLHSIIGR